jgi:hypothetical protein
VNLARLADICIGVAGSLVVAVAALSVVVVQTRTPESDPNAIAAQFNLEVVWYDGESPCGNVEDVAGCYSPTTPDVIYVGQGFDPEKLNSVVLHEIGHAMQDRLNQPSDECAADAFARSLGATWFVYDC